MMLFSLSIGPGMTAQVSTVDELKAAVNSDEEGVITVAPGTYKLDKPLELKSGTTLKGSGIGKTIITQVDSWKPATSSLPDPEVKMKGLDSMAYLIRVQDKAKNVSISDLTLRGPHTHGAVFSLGGDNLKFHRLRIEDFLWSGIRTYGMKNSKIEYCEFIDAGGKWKRGGIPGTDGGISGGAVFMVWSSDVEIANNRISRTKTSRETAHFGIKGRGGRNIDIHHNTIGVNFSIEFPFESADRFEINNNILHGVVSIPKHAGGKVPESGVTYDIHHNYFTTSYAIEFVRNGVKIHHNLFDFDSEKDGGNLISGFGKAPASGPAEFHNNLVSNPGRGVIWINEPYDNFTIRNNHIITRTTATPRKEGLFAFNDKSDFGTISITDNIVECIGLPRPLLRRENSYAADVRGNLLKNVSDAGRFEDIGADTKPGLEKPLKFECGVDGEMKVDGWKAYLLE